MAYTLTDEDRKIAEQLAGGGQQAKPKGNWFTNSLSTAGGILGGIGGSFLAPGAGTAAGGAAGAGFGKFLENLLEGNQAGEGILGEAALGTLGGIGKGFKAIKGASSALRAGDGLGKASQILKMGTAAPSRLQKAGVGMQKGAASMLASQSGLTASQARNMGIQPVKVFSSINKRTGLTNLDDMAEVGRGITGKDGFLSMLTREAVGSTKGVNVPDLRKTATSLLDDVGSIIPDAQRKRLLSNATRAGTAIRGGSKGDLSGLADPQRALDTANTFRDTARNLTTGFTSTADQKQLAKVYNKLADTIETSIYKSPGVNQSVPVLAKAGADDLLFKAQDLRAAGNEVQAKAYENIAKELRNVKDTKGFRSLQKDFVDLSKIDAATAQAEGARSIAGSDITKKAGNLVRNPLNLLATPLDAATPAIAGKMAQAGRSLEGAGTGSLLSPAVKIAGTQLAGRALTGNLPGEDQVQPTDQSLLAPQGAGTLPGVGGASGMDAAALLGGEQPQQSIYSREAVAQDIQKDLAATGGENMDKYITLYNFLNPEDATKQKQASVKEYSQANTALGGIDSIAQMLQQDPGLVERSVAGQVPIVGGLLGGVTGTSEYNAAARNILNSVARLNTGANMPASEEAFYRQTYLPQPGDSQETQQQKLATLAGFFQPFTAGYQ